MNMVVFKYISFFDKKSVHHRDAIFQRSEQNLQKVNITCYN